MLVTKPSQVAVELPNEEEYQKRRQKPITNGRRLNQYYLLFNNYHNNFPRASRHRKKRIQGQISVVTPVCSAQRNIWMIKKRK